MPEDEGDVNTAEPAEPSSAVAVSSIQSCLDELGLDDRSTSSTQFRIYTRGSPPQELGVVHEIGGSRPSLKATCRCPHAAGHSCVCWVSNSDDSRRPQIVVALLKWLHAGAGRTRQQHHELSTTVKRSFGMRVRG